MSTLDDIRNIEHQPVQVKLLSGNFVEVQPLRTRQFFKLLRIVSHGAGQNILSIDLNPEESQEAFTVKLLTTLVFSIPDAEEETLDFISSMTKPVGLIERKELNKVDKERNTDLWAQYFQVMENPELEDFISIIEAVVKNEAGDLQALGKRLTGMFKLAQKVGTPDLPSTQAQNSSEASAELSTSSHPSTDGQTTSS